jgi:hypothetical protein
VCDLYHVTIYMFLAPGALVWGIVGISCVCIGGEVCVRVRAATS